MARFISIIFPAFLLLAACETANNTQPPNSGLVTTYTIVFRNFTTREVLGITDKMENSPGFVRWGDPQGDSSVSYHGYVTRAVGGKLYRYVNDILTEMGFNPDGPVKVIKNGTTFNLDKIF